MSAADRVKWDARYAAGAYQARPHPSAFLVECEPLLPAPGRALDVACGTGRNALFLAERGWAVEAVDISPIALRRGAKRAQGLPIRWRERDLDAGFDGGGRYELIVNIRYVNLPLLRALLGRLRPGGMLLVEQHLALSKTPAVAVCGPQNAAFRVPPGSLRQLASSLRVERCYEGLAPEPDGATAAVSRLLASMPAAPSGAGLVGAKLDRAASLRDSCLVEDEAGA